MQIAQHTKLHRDSNERLLVSVSRGAGSSGIFTEGLAVTPGDVALLLQRGSLLGIVVSFWSKKPPKADAVICFLQ